MLPEASVDTGWVGLSQDTPALEESLWETSTGEQRWMQGLLLPGPACVPPPAVPGPAPGSSASRNGPAIVLSVGMSLLQASGVRPLHRVLIECQWQRKGWKDLSLPARPTLVWPGASWEDSWSSGCSHSFPRTLISAA